MGERKTVSTVVGEAFCETQEEIAMQAIKGISTAAEKNALIHTLLLCSFIILKKYLIILTSFM